MPVLRDVQGFVGVQEFDDIGWSGCVDDARGDELIHGLVVVEFRGVVHEAGAAGVYTAREKGHAERFVVGDALEGSNEVGAFEVLAESVMLKNGTRTRAKEV